MGEISSRVRIPPPPPVFMNLQIKSFFKELDKLHKRHGDKGLFPIYGAGCVNNPKYFFLLMNPTARNVSAFPKWKGIRAPWLGTKNIWKLVFQLGLLSEKTFNKTQFLKPSQWDNDFSLKLYQELAKNKVYLTSLAKCTQKDARPLPNRVFKEYLKQTQKEIHKTKPKCVICFGNQVSSIFLGKNVKVSDYKNKSEKIIIDKRVFRVFPTYYPVGQGLRNIKLAVKRIKSIRL